MSSGNDLAIVHYSTARGYVQSAFLMLSNPIRLSVRDDTSFILSSHLLFGFATELYLKSFLSCRGVSDADLRSPKLGHNLAALLRRAKEMSFASESAETLVDILGKGHSDFRYRYAGRDVTFPVIGPNNAFEGFRHIDSFVDESVGARASLALPPEQDQGRWELPGLLGYWRIPAA